VLIVQHLLGDYQKLLPVFIRTMDYSYTGHIPFLAVYEIGPGLLDNNTILVNSSST